MMLVSPAVSYLLRGGIFAGKTGLGYALDRLIAEAIMYRQHIAAENVPVAKSLAIRVSDPN
jgi:hypothetical protein